MKKLRFCMLLVWITAGATAQELYMPRNIQKAYERGTRALNGAPGKNYWQNHGAYDIDIQFDEAKNSLSGTETIVYSNNSPDTLKSASVRFVNNIHKPEAPRSGQVSPDFLSTGLEISTFKVNGKTIKLDSRNWGTVSDVKLPSPIMPGEKAKFVINWTYPLSKQSGREGQINPQTFYAAYSYPRISVYDDYNGWDRIPHTDHAEFYNDFNDYTLAVKVPKNFVVWATGDLQNPEEVLSPKIAERYKQSLISDEVVAIATAKEMQAGLVTQQKKFNTWRFEAHDISDMTFALSSNYVWDGSSVVVDRTANRRASVQAAYSPDAKDFPHAVAWGREALAWFSSHWPGIAYPYSKMTAFQGFADMEYPMMVNDTSTPDLEFSHFVLNHEIAHTYFPFYMGTNETRYAFMDEGWATTLEYLIGIDQLGIDRASDNFKSFRVKRWINDPSSEEDQPIISMSTQVSGSGYGNNAYGKPALAYLALKDMLGDKTFADALHTYMSRWHGKHPIPWDFFFSFNDGSGKNLNWFWNNWFFSNNYIDLVLDKVTIKGNDYSLQIKNVGGFAIPFDLRIVYSDGKTETLHQNPVIWSKGDREILVEVNASQAIRSLTIENGIFMDATPGNNSWH